MIPVAVLEGDHELLSVLASEIKPGDLKISGHMVRRMVAPQKRLMGYLHWEVTMPDSDLVLGTHEFLDDGCARFMVLRKRIQRPTIRLGG